MAENRKPIAAAGLAHRVGIAVAGSGHVVRDVHHAEDATAHRRPADDLTAGGAVAVGVTQRAPCDDDQDDRDGPGQQAHGSRGHVAHPVTDRAGHVGPDRAGHDDRDGQHAEADTVTALLRIEVAGAVTDAARDRAHHRGHGQPHRGRHAKHRAEDSSQWTRTGLACRGLSRSRLAGLGLARARGGLLAGLAAGRPLARRGSRSGRHAQRVKHRSKVSRQARGIRSNIGPRTLGSGRSRIPASAPAPGPARG